MSTCRDNFSANELSESIGIIPKTRMEGHACLKRLGNTISTTSYPSSSWSPSQVRVPIEETGALHDVVKAGKVLYLGGSSMFAWQFAELQMTAKMNNLTRFISMQNHCNLVYREEEKMNPYCAQSGIMLMPWSPLARGILAGAYQGDLMAGTIVRKDKIGLVPKVFITVNTSFRLPREL